MDYCAPKALPHSQFLAWDPLDRAKALAWQRRQRETHSCGVHPDVWDPERGGDPDGLRLKTKLCRACEIAESGAEAFQRNRMAGMYQAWEFGSPSNEDEEQHGEG